MESITKRKLSDTQINLLVYAGFGDKTEVSVIKELTDGYFNNSYMIEFSNSEKVVLKVAPQDALQVLTYEKNLMHTEVTVLKELSKIGIPVPKILFYDDTRLLIDGEYFFMTFLPGVPMNHLKDKIPPKQYENISQRLGQYAREISKVTSSYFGFIGDKERQFQSWYSCYKRMIMDLIDDANHIQLPLPFSKKEALDLINRYKTELDSVLNPALVHKDLWEGNIFLDENSFEITGIIDCERALYAEPLMESVCGFLDENEKFMSHFYGIKLDRHEQTRIRLYKFYLYLLMFVEVPYRQYDDEGFKKWVGNRLENIVSELINQDQR